MSPESSFDRVWSSTDECKWSIALEGLSEAETAEIHSHMHRRHYDRRSRIFTRGDPANALLIVETGRIRMYHSNEDGEEFTIAIWAAGYNVGLMSTMLNSGRLVSVDSVEDTTVLVLPREKLLQLMKAIPAFAINIARLLASLSSESIQSWSPLALDTAAMRLCKVLHKLAVEDTRSGAGGAIVVHGLSQDDLASMVGVTRTWITITLSTFENQGLIWRRRQEIGIHDMRALERFCANGMGRPERPRAARRPALATQAHPAGALSLAPR